MISLHVSPRSAPATTPAPAPARPPRPTADTATASTPSDAPLTGQRPAQPPTADVPAPPTTPANLPPDRRAMPAQRPRDLATQLATRDPDEDPLAILKRQPSGEYPTRRRNNSASSLIRYAVTRGNPNSTILATRAPTRRTTTRARSVGVNHRVGLTPRLFATLISDLRTRNTIVLRRPDESTAGNRAFCPRVASREAGAGDQPRHSSRCRPQEACGTEPIRVQDGVRPGVEESSNPAFSVAACSAPAPDADGSRATRPPGRRARTVRRGRRRRPRLPPGWSPRRARHRR